MTGTPIEPAGDIYEQTKVTLGQRHASAAKRLGLPRAAACRVGVDVLAEMQRAHPGWFELSLGSEQSLRARAIELFKAKARE